MVPAPTGGFCLEAVVTTRERACIANRWRSDVGPDADWPREAGHQRWVEVPFRRIGLPDALGWNVLAPDAGVPDPRPAGVEVVDVRRDVGALNDRDPRDRTGKLPGSPTYRLELEGTPVRRQTEATENHT